MSEFSYITRALLSDYDTQEDELDEAEMYQLDLYFRNFSEQDLEKCISNPAPFPLNFVQYSRELLKEISNK